MDNELTNNKIKVYTTSAPGGLTVSTSNIQQTLGVTNNKAREYADLAKKYRDEAKDLRDDAKYYAEQNADVTMSYVNELEARLQRGIDSKQASGDYALNSSIPTNVSSLTNDSQYVNTTQLGTAIDSVRLPSQTANDGKFLYTNGETPSWKGVNSLAMFDVIEKDHTLSYAENKGYVQIGEYAYKEAVAGSHYGYPDFYSKCLDEYGNQNNTLEIIKNNYTVVGSPTITSDGIASGFSGSKYIRASVPSLAGATNYVIEGELTPNNLVGSTYYTIVKDKLNPSTAGASLVCGVKTTSISNLAFKPYPNASYTWLGGISNETSHKYKIEVINNVGKVYIDGVQKPNDSTTFDMTDTNWSGDITLGCSAQDASAYFTGSFDLKQFSVTVNGIVTYRAVDCLKTNSNGHKYYDISNKPEIDAIYNNTGEAWYYGVDTVNERILLPRTSGINSGKYLYMVVGNSPNWTGVTDLVSQGTTILNQVNTGISNAIETRLDLGVTNISAAGKNTVINWLSPDYSNGIHFTSSPYTAPSNGICYVTTGAANDTAEIKVNNITVGEVGVHDGNQGSISILVNKDDVISWTNYYSAGTAFGDFFPLKGV